MASPESQECIIVNTFCGNGNKSPRISHLVFWIADAGVSFVSSFRGLLQGILQFPSGGLRPAFTALFLSILITSAEVNSCDRCLRRSTIMTTGTSSFLGSSSLMDHPPLQQRLAPCNLANAGNFIVNPLPDNARPPPAFRSEPVRITSISYQPDGAQFIDSSLTY